MSPSVICLWYSHWAPLWLTPGHSLCVDGWTWQPVLTTFPGYSCNSIKTTQQSNLGDTDCLVGCWPDAGPVSIVGDILWWHDRNLRWCDRILKSIRLHHLRSHAQNYLSLTPHCASVIFPLGTTVAHPGSQSHQYLLAISAWPPTTSPSHMSILNTPHQSPRPNACRALDV